MADQQSETSPDSDITDMSNSFESYKSTEIEHVTNFDDMVLLKAINQTKFPVFLGTLASDQQMKFAVKLFPFQNGQLHPNFVNEIKFINLRHENVISTLHYTPEKEATFTDCTQKISYTIMEFAPYGDFCDLITNKTIHLDEKLVRTFFHQLIGGLEYLHSEGVAHLDLKMENLLLGQNYKLKICDFDLSHSKDQEDVTSHGTVCYRAPELVYRQCENPQAADIYSAGVILFVMMTQGMYPYIENEDGDGLEEFYMAMREPNLFWENMCRMRKVDSEFFSEEFKSLFGSMVDFNPRKRSTIEQIKQSKWYKGEVYEQNEIETLLGASF